jgi:hypothetical protein
MFYLLDDGFRIGDQDAMVESFSIRPVKLRHQRDPCIPSRSAAAAPACARDVVLPGDVRRPPGTMAVHCSGGAP